jgi:ATP-dependent RNA helicase DHX29
MRQTKGSTFADSGTEGVATADSKSTTPPSMNSPSQIDHSPDVETLSTSQSETESDLEPDELLGQYLSVQRRLFEINPESFDFCWKGQRHGKNKAAAVNGELKLNTDPVIARLTAKLKKIKSDVLFDEDEAKRRWAEIQIDLAKDASDRKRLGIRDINDLKQPKDRIILNFNANDSGSPDDGEDAADMLGELFSTLPDTTTDPATGLSGMSTLELGGSTVKIRDFGKSTGMSPRRIFEEACKSRYGDSCVKAESTLTRFVETRPPVCPTS